MSKKKTLFDRLSEMSKLAEEQEKRASTPGDPGGYVGGSSHPTANADNNGIAATEGARSSENTSDVKKDVGTAAVDNESEATPGSGKTPEEASKNTSLNATTTGENSAVEDDYKGDKDDPGTGVPAKAGIGEKYSSLSDAALYEEAVKLANALLADIATGVLEGSGKKAQATKEAAGEATLGDLRKDPAAVKAAAQGYEAANQALSVEQELIANTIKQAQEDAAIYGAFIQGLDSELQKLADDDEEEDDDDDAEESGDGGASGDSTMDEASGGEMGGEMGGEVMPPDAGAEGAAVGAGGEGVDQLLAEMGGMGAGPEAGMGMPPGGGMGAGPEMGGMPPEAGMGGEGDMGGGNEDMIIQELIAALAEAGISPEELMSLGGDEGQKIASTVRTYQRSGGYQIKEAKTKEARNLRNMLKGYVIELVSRSS